MPDSITRFPRRVVRGLARRLRGTRPTPKATAPAAAAPKAAPRTIDDIDTLHEFWRQPAPDGNVPATYVGPIGRSEVLLKLISDLPPETRILEVGCNVGRNLAYLVDHGYPNVEGIEISPHAVELLRQTYPQLEDSNIHLGSAEDVLPGLADDSFDLVFTMAVIEHIHPSSTTVFDDMVRVWKSILSIEPPGRTSHRQYPHDVPKIFQSRGLRLVSSTPMSQFPQTANDKGIAIFSAYRFERTS
jgi:SAM-dependent methyltransferase